MAIGASVCGRRTAVPTDSRRWQRRVTLKAVTGPPSLHVMAICTLIVALLGPVAVIGQQLFGQQFSLPLPPRNPLDNRINGFQATPASPTGAPSSSLNVVRQLNNNDFLNTFRNLFSQRGATLRTEPNSSPSPVTSPVQQQNNQQQQLPRLLQQNLQFFGSRLPEPSSTLPPLAPVVRPQSQPGTGLFGNLASLNEISRFPSQGVNQANNFNQQQPTQQQRGPQQQVPSPATINSILESIQRARNNILLAQQRQRQQQQPQQQQQFQNANSFTPLLNNRNEALPAVPRPFFGLPQPTVSPIFGGSTAFLPAFSLATTTTTPAPPTTTTVAPLPFFPPGVLNRVDFPPGLSEQLSSVTANVQEKSPGEKAKILEDATRIQGLLAQLITAQTDRANEITPQTTSPSPLFSTTPIPVSISSLPSLSPIIVTGSGNALTPVRNLVESSNPVVLVPPGRSFEAPTLKQLQEAIPISLPKGLDPNLNFDVKTFFDVFEKEKLSNLEKLQLLDPARKPAAQMDAVNEIMNEAIPRPSPIDRNANSRRIETDIIQQNLSGGLAKALPTIEPILKSKTPAEQEKLAKDTLNVLSLLNEIRRAQSVLTEAELKSFSDVPKIESTSRAPTTEPTISPSQPARTSPAMAVPSPPLFPAISPTQPTAGPTASPTIRPSSTTVFSLSSVSAARVPTEAPISRASLATVGTPSRPETSSPPPEQRPISSSTAPAEVITPMEIIMITATPTPARTTTPAPAPTTTPSPMGVPIAALLGGNDAISISLPNPNRTGSQDMFLPPFTYIPPSNETLGGFLGKLCTNFRCGVRFIKINETSTQLSLKLRPVAGSTVELPEFLRTATASTPPMNMEVSTSTLPTTPFRPSTPAQQNPLVRSLCQRFKCNFKFVSSTTPAPVTTGPAQAPQGIERSQNSVSPSAVSELTSPSPEITSITSPPAPSAEPEVSTAKTRRMKVRKTKISTEKPVETTPMVSVTSPADVLSGLTTVSASLGAVESSRSIPVEGTVSTEGLPTTLSPAALTTVPETSSAPAETQMPEVGNLVDQPSGGVTTPEPAMQEITEIPSIATETMGTTEARNPLLPSETTMAAIVEVVTDTTPAQPVEPQLSPEGRSLKEDIVSVNEIVPFSPLETVGATEPPMVSETGPPSTAAEVMTTEPSFTPTSSTTLAPSVSTTTSGSLRSPGLLGGARAEPERPLRLLKELQGFYFNRLYDSLFNSLAGPRGSGSPTVQSGNPV